MKRARIHQCCRRTGYGKQANQLVFSFLKVREMEGDLHLLIFPQRKDGRDEETQFSYQMQSIWQLDQRHSTSQSSLNSLIPGCLNPILQVMTARMHQAIDSYIFSMHPCFLIIQGQRNCLFCTGESYLQKFIMTFDYTHLQSSYLATWLSYLFCIAYSQEK